MAFVRLPPHLGYESHHPRDVTLPFTIAYTATLAKESGREVAVIDVWARNRTMREVLDEIRAANPDAILFEAHASEYPVVSKCAELVRKFSDATILAFGSVPTFLPQRVVGPDLPFDVALRGESEESSMAVLEALDEERSLDEIEGIAFWNVEEGRVQQNADRPPIEDLDRLPIIDYDLFDLEAYRKLSFPMPLHRRVRWGHVLATRGCPYPCTHCSFDHRQSFGRSFRKHSPQRIADSLATLVARGVNAVSIEDDIFTLDRKYALDVCDAIERRGVRVKWVIQTRVDCIDRELLRRMKSAGCVGVSLGIESGNDRVLSVLKKGFNREQALEGIRLCGEEGFMMRLLFMIGNPTETAREIEDTIDLACRSKAVTIQVHISTPYPGTGLLGKAEADGEYIEDFSSYNKIVQNLSATPDEELWRLQKKFYRQYFFSWRYFRLFTRQRLFYILGSWRHDLPLIARTFWYLVWEGRRQGKRDVGRVFAGLEAVAAAGESAGPTSSNGFVSVENIGVMRDRKEVPSVQ